MIPAVGPFEGLRDILPKLAINIGWLKLMGESLVAQTRLQSKISKPLAVSPEGKAHRARQQSARSVAKSRRRGYYGLLKAIKAA